MKTKIKPQNKLKDMAAKKLAIVTFGAEMGPPLSYKQFEELQPNDELKTPFFKEIITASKIIMQREKEEGWGEDHQKAHMMNIKYLDKRIKELS